MNRDAFSQAVGEVFDAEWRRASRQGVIRAFVLGAIAASAVWTLAAIRYF